MKEYSREAVYEGPNYVFTKTRLVVQATYNPATQQDSWGFTPKYGQPANNNPGLPYVPDVSNPRAARANNPAVGIAPIGAPSFSLPANYNGNPKGVPAVVSDAALRHALMQPRQQLVFSVGGIISIFSPLAGFQTDAMGGPHPLFCNVSEIQGTRTWLVEYAIETYINECPIYAGKPPAILSHIWTMGHTLDQDYFTTQTIKGRVVFRMDALVRMGLNPDNYRGLMAIGVPLGFKRERIEVSAGPEPNILEYIITDRQLPLGWNQAGVTRLQATHTVSTEKEAGDVVALRSIGAAVDSIITGIRGASANIGRMASGDLPLLKEFEAGAAIALDATSAEIGIAKAGFDFSISQLPINYHTIVVDVWGDSTSTRESLEYFARQIIQSRIITYSINIGQLFGGAMNAAGLGDLWQQIINSSIVKLPNGINANLPGIGKVNLQFAAKSLLSGLKTSVTHDLAGKMVHVEYTAISGPLLSALDLTTKRAQFNSVVLPGSDDTGTLILVGGQPPGPVGDFVSRGSYLGQCVAQALQASCDIPQTGGMVDQRPPVTMPTNFNGPPILPPVSGEFIK